MPCVQIDNAPGDFALMAGDIFRRRGFNAKLFAKFAY
jgi:hypothetical protein